MWGEKKLNPYIIPFTEINKDEFSNSYYCLLYIRPDTKHVTSLY